MCVEGVCVLRWGVCVEKAKKQGERGAGGGGMVRNYIVNLIVNVGLT